MVGKRNNARPIKTARPKYTPGSRGMSILLAAIDGAWFDVSVTTERVTCLRLHERGLLTRDPKSSTRYRASETGIELARAEASRRGKEA